MHKLATPLAVTTSTSVCACGYIVTPNCTRYCLFSVYQRLAASVGIIRDMAGCHIVENRWVTSGAASCIELRELMMGEPEY